MPWTKQLKFYAAYVQVAGHVVLAVNFWTWSFLSKLLNTTMLSDVRV